MVYFFVMEGQGRTLEEIDTMYIMHVPAMKSSKWKTPTLDEIGRTNRADEEAAVDAAASEKPSDEQGRETPPVAHHEQI